MIGGWVPLAFFIRRPPFAGRGLLISLGVLLLLGLPVVVRILFEPLYGWDGRSIWFFHGKMLFHAGALGPDIGLLNPT